MNVLEHKHVEDFQHCFLLLGTIANQDLLGLRAAGSLPGRRHCHSSVIREWMLTRSLGYTTFSACCPEPVLAAPSGPTFFQASSGKLTTMSRPKLIAKLL